MRDDIDAWVLSGTPGNYPWDGWKTRALAAGVPEELATLGRAVMREAYQHQWAERLQVVCGWEDEGKVMIELVLEDPEETAALWRDLLNTDGCRGRLDPKTGEWISWL